MMADEFLINWMALMVGISCAVFILKQVVRITINTIKAELYDEILKDEDKNTDKNL